MENRLKEETVEVLSEKQNEMVPKKLVSLFSQRSCYEFSFKVNTIPMQLDLKLK